MNIEQLLSKTGLFNLVKVEDVTDGYHSFGELYEHRNLLFCVLLTLIYREGLNYKVWKSKLHSDGTMFEGDWFIAGMSDPNGHRQITYHMEVSKYWGILDVPEIEFSPEYDGHSPDDVLERLVSILV